MDYGGNGVLNIGRARKGGTWDVCKNGDRIPLKDYKTLKSYLKTHYGNTGIKLRFMRGVSKKEMIPLERIVERS